MANKTFCIRKDCKAFAVCGYALTDSALKNNKKEDLILVQMNCTEKKVKDTLKYGIY